jgi:hypothetical protein
MTSEFMKRLLAAGEAKYGPLPESFHFGDGIDWDSPIEETLLHVELPFWLMVAPGPVEVSWHDVTFAVEICPPWIEVFAGGVLDSRATAIHYGLERPEPWSPTEPMLGRLNEAGMPWLERLCKTVVRLKAFNTIFASHQADPVAEGIQLDGFVAADDDAAKAMVLELVQSMGFHAVDAGPLSRAQQLEQLAFLNIALNATMNGSWSSGWKLVGAPASVVVPA